MHLIVRKSNGKNNELQIKFREKLFLCMLHFGGFTHKNCFDFFRKRDNFPIIKSSKVTNLKFLLFIGT